MAAVLVVKPTLSSAAPQLLKCRPSRFVTTAITCGPRSNRGPLQKGRSLSTEAILAVQALKRAARTNESKVEDVISGTILRLTKPDLAAALAELQRQDQCKLALRVYVAARDEFSCDTDYGLYADMVAALARNGMAEEIDNLIEDVLGKGVINPGGDMRGLAKLLKSLIAARKGGAATMIYRAMKIGGCVIDEFMARVLRNGLRKLGEVETADEVDKDYDALVNNNVGRVGRIRDKQALICSEMESQKSSSGTQPSTVAQPAMTSCRKKKSQDSSFLGDLRDHIDEFVHASMEEHQTCFTKTIKKMFGMSKVVAERESKEKEVESHLPLQTTVHE